MNNYISTAPLYDSDYLAHHGIKGQKWGIRRYQNEDGTLTEAGKKKYGLSDKSSYNKKIRALNRLDKDMAVAGYHSDFYNNLAENYKAKNFKQEKINKVKNKAKAYADWYNASKETTFNLFTQMLKSDEGFPKYRYLDRSVMTKGEKIASFALASAAASAGGVGTYTNYVTLGKQYYKPKKDDIPIREN